MSLLLDMFSRRQVEGARASWVLSDLSAYIKSGLVLSNAWRNAYQLSDVARPPSPLPLPLAIAAELLDLLYQATLVSKTSASILESINMVAQYTVFGRQVGSHVVSLLRLSHTVTSPNSWSSTDESSI